MLFFAYIYFMLFFVESEKLNRIHLATILQCDGGA